MSSKSESGISIYATSYSEEITGSNTMIIIRWPDSREARFLVDFGIFQEEAWRQYNGRVPYDMEKINFAIATHAHADHIGLFPVLYKNNSDAIVYCSDETKRFMPIMLNETATQEINNYKRDVRVKKREEKRRKAKKIKGKGRKYSVNKNGQKDNAKSKQPGILYTKYNVMGFKSKVYAMPIGKSFSPMKGIEVTFYKNGHVVGAVLTVVRVFDKNEEMYFLITGDIGVRNRLTGVETYLPKKIAEKISFVISEATYGEGKEKVDVKLEEQKMEDIIKRAYNEKKRIVVPSYAFERLSTIISDVATMEQTPKMEKYLKDMPIFFDTKLGLEFLNTLKKIIPDLKLPKNFHIISTKEEKNYVKSLSPPYMLFTTSAHLNQGAILSYLEFLECYNTIIMFAGYVPERVQEYMELEKGTEIKINGNRLELNCEMEIIKHYTAHMDHWLLLEFLSQFTNAKTVLFQHGSNEAKQSMVNAVVQTNRISQNMLYGKTIKINKDGIVKDY